MSPIHAASFNSSLASIMKNLKDRKDVAASIQELNSLPIEHISFKMIRQLDELIASVTGSSGSARECATPATPEISHPIDPKPMEDDNFMEHQHQRVEKRKFNSSISMEPAHKRGRF